MHARTPGTVEEGHADERRGVGGLPMVTRAIQAHRSTPTTRVLSAKGEAGTHGTEELRETMLADEGP